MSRRTLARAPDPHQAPPVSAAVRRDLFGTVGALLLLSAAEAGPAKAAELDGELLACCAEADRLEAQADVLTAGWPSSGQCPRWMEADRLMDEAYDLRERATELPARTPEGLQAKARLVLARLDADGLAGEIAQSLARDVLGKAGQTPPVGGHPRDSLPHPDAQLLAACAAFDALERAYIALSGDHRAGSPEEAAVEAERDWLVTAQAPLVASMCELRAVTQAGHVARARSLTLWDGELLKDTVDAGACLTAALVRDLIGKAPSPAMEAARG